MSDITVIIPFLNEGTTLRQTMEMLIKQSLKAKKIIMIDSGSTDDSANIINEYVSKKNNRTSRNIEGSLNLQKSCIQSSII